MRDLLIGSALAALTALACGMPSSTSENESAAGTDLTGPFVGTWTGPATTTDGRSGSATAIVTRTGNSTLAIGGICATGNVPAAVTSPTTISLQATSCAAASVSVGAGACTVQYQVSGGTGTLGASQQLTLTVTGTVVNLDPACTTLVNTPYGFTLIATKQ
jgi:hypothetical protein